MKKIFGSLLKKSSTSGGSRNGNKIALVTNYNACPLGLSITKQLSQNYTVVAVSHTHDDKNDAKNEDNVSVNGGIVKFEAHLNEQTERNRLIAFLKEENFTIDRIVHNQPYMIKPTPPEKMIDPKNPSPKEQIEIENRVSDLKERIRILVETSLFVNSDLLDQNLINEQARILQIIQKQPGIYGLLRASQINLRKCLAQPLQDKQIGMTSLLPGIYQQTQIDYLKVKFQPEAKNNKQNEQEEEIQLLNSDTLASFVVDELLNNVKVNLLEYCKQMEWNIYQTGYFKDSNGQPIKEPKLYSNVFM